MKNLILAIAIMLGIGATCEATQYVIRYQNGKWNVIVVPEYNVYPYYPYYPEYQPGYPSYYHPAPRPCPPRPCPCYPRSQRHCH